ncbi:MAG: helicase-exonuclease AddAB subunit AddB, partial [Lachnospiraceae bacterium]|nr:helicase-exonuclease AddAB subunit AddB [Lachnospiraceae bacterium]
MSLQIIAGPSGSGKSTYAYQSVIEEAIQYPDRHYIIIVPDQFSMSTTREICRLHPAGGIMNIEVLSFSRLCYRIGDEVGSGNRAVLDDTGKNLILRRVALSMEQQLTFLKGRMKRPGYVHEVKSQISEFYQYDISDGDLEAMINASKDRGYLNQKLADLRLLYKGFSDYIRDKYITTEEALSELARMIPKSDLLAGSTVLFDNFTGFTPVQDKVIRQLLLCCRKVSVTLCLGQKKDEKLFTLTHKSYEKLIRLAGDLKVSVLPEVRLPQDNAVRYQEHDSMAFLEQNLLRGGGRTYKKAAEGIRIYEAASARDEVQWCCRRINELIRQGYEYRQIAIETGDLEGYGNLLSYELGRFGIPYYMDLRRSVMQNP